MMEYERYWYLASAYSHPSAEVRQQRFLDALHAFAWLMQRGILVFSPIVQCHQAAVEYDLPKGHEFWQVYDEVMITRSFATIVLKFDYWKDSKGVASEIAFTRRLGHTLQELIFVNGEYKIQDWND